MKELYIEEYERLYSEAEEAGLPIDEDALADKAMDAARDRLCAMIDEAKDRRKYAV